MARNFLLPPLYILYILFFLQSFVSLKVSYTYMKIHTLALDSSWHGLMLCSYLPLSITIHVLTHTLFLLPFIFPLYNIYIYTYLIIYILYVKVSFCFYILQLASSCNLLFFFFNLGRIRSINYLVSPYTYTNIIL